MNKIESAKLDTEKILHNREQLSDISAPYYKALRNEVAIFEHAYKCRLPILLKGPTGTGKTRFVAYMAHLLGRNLISVSCNEETSSTDLIGRYIIKGAETIWVDGPLTQAVKSGAIIYLDEVAEARPDVIVAIHALTDHRKELYMDKLGITIKAHENFSLVASYNPSYQRGFKDLKPSTRQRFIALSFQYPKPTDEIEILINETPIDEATAKKLVNIANKIRNLTELGLAETVSTRLLVDAALLIHSGLSKRVAVKSAIVEPLTDDLETTQALSDLCDLMI